MSEREPSEQELREALEEQMRRVRVEDVLVQTAVTLVNLAGRRLGLAGDERDVKDLGQARLTIDGSRALVPLLPSESAGPVKEALSQLQIAYAREAPRDDRPAAASDREEKSAPGSEPEDPDRAKARAKIWTPPGA